MTTKTEEETTGEAVEQFAGRCLGVMNNAAAALLASIGHQTGLFDTMAVLPTSSSARIASAAGLNERYVREWLNGMTVTGFVEYSPETRTYSLPAAHAALLTTAAGPDNIAQVLQFVAMMGEVEQKIVERFRTGGGLSYSDYPRFHQTMAEESAATFDAALLGAVLPLVPDLPARLATGIDVADVGCGSGHAINLMADAYPTSTFTGYDFSEEAIAHGRSEAARMGLANATFVLQDVADLHAPDSFDLVTAFDAIHDQAHPATVLANIGQALRRGGQFLMVDFKASSNVEENIGLPWAGFLYAMSTFHCMSVSLGLDGDGLGTAWGEQVARRMLTEAGLRDIETKSIESDPFNNYFVATKK
ncbi:class I SAM-dependent methyltransferase [Arthrobacter castelli]|uniref:class I SAM-dependent methyltransferase n=1 Tax=Arthrobacter castelli TaxID=271431 RepID=UPI000423F947|nr:class I SAM-dependent methyltransferase [Arthrobacter castelli]